MGAFDVLFVQGKCEQCDNEIQKRIQFKYRTPWQRTFQLGDKLEWEGNPVRWNGAPLPGLIALDAALEECLNCNYEDEFYIIYMDDGIFVGAGGNRGRFRFGHEDHALLIEKYVSEPPGILTQPKESK